MIYKNFFKYTALLLFIILSYTVFLKAENISNNRDSQLIKELYETWHNAVESSNIDGYINSLDKNITLSPPGGPVISGAENYREFLGPVFESATYKIQDGDYDIEVIGDIAIVRSRQTVYLTFKDNANKIQSEGALQDNITTSDYLDILKRQEDGSWKCLVHTWQLIPS